MNLQAPRIVSKSRYLSRKVGLIGSGSLLFLLGMTGTIICATLLLISILECLGARWEIVPGVLAPAIILGIPVCLLGGALFVLVVWFGGRQMEKAERLEPLVPLTRQTADHLPAEQSLVRASSEPSEVQQAVLLRAAGSDMQTPPEELLRATIHESGSEK